MRIRNCVLGLLFLAACGEKKAPEPAVVEAAVEAPPVEPIVEPEYTPPPPAPKRDNADFNATVTFSGGKTASGHVKRVERSTDWYGEEGWEDDDSYLKVALEGNGTLKDATWKEMSSITVTPGKMATDVDCTYSSDYSPWMYTCELKTPTNGTTTDGKKWTVTSRYKWRFTFDDDSSVEFWMARYPARLQETRVYEYDEEVVENYQIYTQLQDTLRQQTGEIVKSVTIK